jgi:AcrR family transcriptional regulator
VATRKLGRPRDSSSEETRDRLLDVARRLFASGGYDGTTNKELAVAAGLTTGAIYHYFESKQDLYLAVHGAVQTVVYRRFRAAAAAAKPTCVDQLLAVLDEARALNAEDPSLATFLVTARTDLPRHPELIETGAFEPIQRFEFFGEIVDLGIAEGNIAPEDRQMTLDVISALMMGLVSASSGDPETHRRAIEGVKRLITGRLLSLD